MSYATMADQMAIANQGRQNAMSQARKFIRNPHVAPNPYVTPISELADIDELDTLPVKGTGSVRQMNHGPPNYEQYQQPPPHFFRGGPPGYPVPQPSPQFLRPPPVQKESFEENLEDDKDKKLNCIDIAEHVKDCPICSKFYKRDNTLYIIVIVVLAIITILLLKRVLNI